MLTRSKSQRHSEVREAVFQKAKCGGREGPGTAKVGREEGAGGKARSPGVWETCVLEFKLTQSKEVFHPCFPRYGPGATAYSFHRPGTLPLEKKGFSSAPVIRGRNLANFCLSVC